MKPHAIKFKKIQRKKKKARNKIAYITHFKIYLDNLPTQLLSTMFGINTAK